MDIDKNTDDNCLDQISESKNSVQSTDKNKEITSSDGVNCEKSSELPEEQLSCGKTNEDSPVQKLEESSINSHLLESDNREPVADKARENIALNVEQKEISPGIVETVPVIANSDNTTELRHTAVYVDIVDVTPKPGCDLSPNCVTPVKGTDSSAFTKCQEAFSGTEDSEDDSSSSSETDSESSSSVELKKPEVEESSSEEEVIRKTSQSSEPKTRDRLSANRNKEKQKCAKYKGELDVEDLPPIEDLQITVKENECEPLGKVCSIVNQLVVVESLPNTPALNLDSVLFKKDGTFLGQIFDVFGPVKTPFYSLRFNSRQDIDEKGIEIGQTVYCAPQTCHTKYVFVYQLMQQKGSDASWKHNYEVPEDQQDYSDDEQEKMAKRKHQQRNRDKPNSKNDGNEAPLKKQLRKSTFNHNYQQYTGDEWYRARVSEMNQFNRSSSNQFNRPSSARSNLSSYNNFSPHNGNFNSNLSAPSIHGETVGVPSPFSSPVSLIRPPVPNNWNRPPSNCPPNPGFGSPPPIFSNHPPSAVPFSSPPPLSIGSSSYERLSSDPTFPNPLNFQPPSPWSQNQPPRRPPFRIDNTRKTDLVPPRPLQFVQPLPRPNLPPRQPWIANPSPPLGFPTANGQPMNSFNRPPQPPHFQHH